MVCDQTSSRERVQQQLLSDNPGHSHKLSTPRPDGDAEVATELVEALIVPTCERCDGVLIPDVVFFGGSVPKTRVAKCNEAVASADAVLAVGSSLQVFSGYRFCRLAGQLGKPLAIINPGSTRADSLASLKLLSDCEPLLQALAANISGEGRPIPCVGGSPS